MIPYDDLVAALASWRQRQGLPTGQIPASAVAPAPAAPAPAPPAGRAAAPGGRPATAPGGRPPTSMGAGPAARPPAAAAAPAPAARPPAAVIVDSQDESLELFEEGGFDGDFAMSFSTDEPAESTAMEAPPPSSPGTGHRPPRRSGR